MWTDDDDRIPRGSSCTKLDIYTPSDTDSYLHSIWRDGESERDLGVGGSKAAMSLKKFVGIGEFEAF